ncbi:DnaJ sub C member 25 [Perkinsus chesapeaki]|uniref:DnaJ sub C member 25 n=1 Tax=Perkinsus chesapeaki TaxID=330153 RepID=A0A7J6MXY1_PERCH|nr:DnaJ sub C member 25 [Perkinsus chesapeaki]
MNCHLLRIFCLVFLAIVARGSDGAADDDDLGSEDSLAKLYCGRDNCYDLLELSRDATPQEIKHSYRRLARLYHPDKQPHNSEAQREAQAIFTKIARAYEVLSSPKLREAYDLYVDYPEYAAYNYYNYYNAVYKPQTPVWIVVSAVLLLLSGIQYLNDSLQYQRVTNAVRKQRQFQQRVKERLTEEAGGTRALRKMPSADRDQLEREALHVPSQTIGFRFIRSPLTFVEWVAWKAHWVYRFNIKKEEYGPAEREYLTRTALKLSEDDWHMLEDNMKEQLLDKKLYEGDNLQEYLKEREREERARLEKSGAYKRYQRIKRAGPTSYNYNED